jgi:hypothetical protein
MAAPPRLYLDRQREEERAGELARAAGPGDVALQGVPPDVGVVGRGVDQRLRVLAWEKQALSAGGGIKRAGRHSEYAIKKKAVCR